VTAQPGEAADAHAGPVDIEGREGRLLGELVDAAQIIPPAQLAAPVARQRAAVGLRDLVLQLQDYGQQQLMPMAGQAIHDVESLDASMAGPVFTSHSLLEPVRPEGVRLWAALLNGTDRVRILSVTADTVDEPTRRLVRRLAGLVADLIVTKGVYTDVCSGFAAARCRCRPRCTGASTAAAGDDHPAGVGRRRPRTGILRPSTTGCCTWRSWTRWATGCAPR